MTETRLHVITRTENYCMVKKRDDTVVKIIIVLSDYSIPVGMGKALSKNRLCDQSKNKLCFFLDWLNLTKILERLELIVVSMRDVVRLVWTVESTKNKNSTATINHES